MMLPFMVIFFIFTTVPVVMSLPMGFTDFDMVQLPKFVGLSNYTTLFLNDSIFVQSIRVTLVFAIFTGPLSYVLCFLLAWLINELHPKLKTIFTLIFYAPSMANVYTVWQLIFSGDSYGYLNSVLLNLGIINSPIQWLTDGEYVLGVTIVVQLWLSLGSADHLRDQIPKAFFIINILNFKTNDHLTISFPSFTLRIVLLERNIHCCLFIILDRFRVFDTVCQKFSASRFGFHCLWLLHLTYPSYMGLSVKGSGFPTAPRQAKSS
jgi:hypothetical protein